MFKSIIIITLFLFCFSVFSQEKTENQVYKNEIGVVVTDLANGTSLLRYERFLAKHMTLALSVGYKSEKGLIRFRGLNSGSIKTNDFTYSGLKLIPEFRYYLKKTMINKMDGFYLGAYVKYSDFKSDLDGTFINENKTDYDVEYDAKFNITSIGLMVGYKLRIANRFTIDFLIAGPGGGRYNFKLTQKKSLPPEFYEDLNEALSNYSIFDFIDGDFEFKEVNLKSNFSAISFRYGITVGYSF
ncbi:DUF3575 domain-containing protein [Tamlana sp. 2201CG12-4]|uniref:DUF3575 domain-containing protein n=1 Tax=Tamlana sp. 2201CG12-4 TaxID=3112582 RepID=UPI002DC05EFB|nr:DUF3575 domain-containing protein [Tamlana sp. 2201CG12-4]MEC3908643.1 DUF3575 domain-containing protein [Tamlana sp. 2201CG12-4]